MSGPAGFDGQNSSRQYEREQGPASMVYGIGTHPMAREIEIAGKRHLGLVLRPKNTPIYPGLDVFSEVSERKNTLKYAEPKGNAKETLCMAICLVLCRPGKSFLKKNYSF